MLSDPSSRTIRYLRLSVTPDCQMRCVYCRPPSDAPGLNAGHADLLAIDEIEQLVRRLVAMGVRKVRLTGGDPTARPELVPIIARLAAIDGLSELAMTTHGLTLARLAETYRSAGLHRVNISLDSLCPERFAAITGATGLERVIAGIDAAVAAGLSPKLNTVVLRGLNDGDLADIVRFAVGRGLESRFIELMPMGPQEAAWPQRYVPRNETQRRLDDLVESWQPIEPSAGAAKSFRVRLRDGREGRVGFIAAMSCPFCAACDRIRVGANGTLMACLMGAPVGSLMPALRPHFDPDRLDQLLNGALRSKAAWHPAAGPGIMTRIGG